MPAPGLLPITGTSLELMDDVFARYLRDAPLVGEGQLASQVIDPDPGHINGLMVGIIFCCEMPARGFQQEMMDGLVHPVTGDGEPVVDAAQR